MGEKQAGKRTRYNTRETGAKYEAAAARYLRQHGYEIIERNYRNRYGEIDIVAKEKQVLCFVEVKYRKDRQSGGALEAVDKRKQRQISRAAFFYCATKAQGEDTLSRFDVIAIESEKTMTHIKNAFFFQA